MSNSNKGFLVEMSHATKGVNFAVFTAAFAIVLQSHNINLLRMRLPASRKAQVAGITDLDELEKLSEQDFLTRKEAYLKEQGLLNAPEADEGEQDESGEPTLDEIATLLRRAIRAGTVKGKVVPSRNGQPGTITFETPVRPAPQRVSTDAGGETVGSGEPVAASGETGSESQDVAAAEAA